MAVFFLGFLLVGGAAAASQGWLDRHFLPSFLISRLWYVRIETTVRLAFAAAGISLMIFSRPITAWMKAIGFVRIVQVVVAIVLALVASELVMQRVRLRPAEWRAESEEPRREPDPRLGWTFQAARTAYAINRGGERIEYVFDARGYRVRNAQQQIDLATPSNLFVGESVMFGDGLRYDDSIPSQVEASVGIPSINAAVYGYSTDQTYLRLERELQRVQHPKAVIALFMTALFGRNLDDDRPHLEPGLSWQPAAQHGRLISLAGLLVPFRREATIATGIVVTREVLRALTRLVRAHGAKPLVVVPTFGPEAGPERALRQRIFSDPDVPFVLVEIDPAWHIPWDHHPDARAAHAIASAIISRLR